jgi:hypothetical protein
MDLLGARGISEIVNSGPTGKPAAWQVGIATLNGTQASLFGAWNLVSHGRLRELAGARLGNPPLVFFT